MKPHFLFIMIILILLIVVILIGIYIEYKDECSVGGPVIYIISGILLLFHIALWLLASYDYGVFVAKRSAFVESLQEARKSNNNIEVAAITKEVAEWNQKLAERKYNRTVFLLKDYVDKRTEKLNPIR